MGYKGRLAPRIFGLRGLGRKLAHPQIEKVTIKISERALGRELACPYR